MAPYKELHSLLQVFDYLFTMFFMMYMKNSPKTPQNIVKFINFWLILVFFALLSAAQVRADDLHTPAIWKGQLRDSTVYFIGTFHLLKPDVQWMTPTIQTILDEANSLTLEADNTQMNPRLVNYLVQQHGIYKRGSIADALSPEDYVLYKKRWAESGLPEEMRDKLMPWYASITLSAQLMQQWGYSNKHGVEAVLTEEATKRNIPIDGLEMAIDQIRSFSQHDEKWQAEFLVQGLEDLDSAEEDIDAMQAAWLAGDEATLKKLTNDAMRDTPDLFQTLLINRNRNWLAGLKHLFTQPGVHIVAVGTSHLIGDYSVIKMLNTDGYHISRF